MRGKSRHILPVGPARVGYGAIAAVFACPSALLAPSPLDAHTATAQWAYPPACCHGDLLRGECERIPDRAVHASPGGWVVVLKPGDHRKVTRRHRFFIPRGKEMRSIDGDFHICLYPSEEDENCFFVPPNSM